MNGFTAADMSTAAANGFRDGLAAQPAAAQEAVAVWTVTREGDPTFPRAYFSEAAADAMVAHITLAPFAVKRAPVAAAPVDGRDVRSAIAGLEGSVAVGSDGEWVSVRRTARDAAVTALRNLSSDCAHIYAAYAEAKASTPAAPGIYLRAVVSEYIAARDAHELATRPLNSHAPVRQLRHGSPIIRRWADAREALRLAMSDASPKGGSDACIWTDDGEGNWATACGEIFTLMEGSPAENKMRHCPYCGKNLRATDADVCGAVIGASYEDTRSEAHDAARYRWLRNHYEPSFHDSECDSLIGLHGEDLDDAIDDEMQATSAEVGA